MILRRSARRRPAPDGSSWIAALATTAATLDDVDAGLRTEDGVRLLVAREDLCREIEERVTAIGGRLSDLEGALDAGGLRVGRR